MPDVHCPGDADPTAREMFAASVREVLGPLRNPRYVVPRSADFLTDTWVSKLLPELIGRYFRKKTRRLAMWHAVPSELARNKHLVEIYQRCWNRHVSPGEPVFAQRGEGRELVREVRRQGLCPRGEVHRKELFF